MNDGQPKVRQHWQRVNESELLIVEDFHRLAARQAESLVPLVDDKLSRGVQLVFNTTAGAQAIADSFSLRRTALTIGIPYYTTIAGARAAVQAIAALKAGGLEVASLRSYFEGSF